MSKASVQKLYREGRELYVRDEAGLIKATCLTHEVASATAMGEGLEEKFYTYQGVPEENRQEIDKLVAGLKKKLGEQITRTASIGADLLRAKALLGKRGKFGIWLQSEFRLSVRTAQNYMLVAKRFPDLNATVADNLSPSAAYALAAKSTSREVGDEFIKRAAAGESISGKNVKERLVPVKYTAFNETRPVMRVEYTAINETRPARRIEYTSGPVVTIPAPHTAILRPSVTDDSSDKVLTGPDFFRAMNDKVARDTRDALMGIAWVIEHRAGSADAVAQLLLEVDNQQHLPKVRAAIDFVAEVKTALNERLNQKLPGHLRSVN
jgi:hypothetical protein